MGSLPTTEPETLNDAKEAPEESNDIIKHEVDEVDEADEANDMTDKTIGIDGVIVIDSEMIPDESTDAEVNVTGGMEVAETRDAEGNTFKDLLKREFNTEMIIESIDAQGSEAVKGLLDGEFTLVNLG